MNFRDQTGFVRGVWGLAVWFLAAHLGEAGNDFTAQALAKPPLGSAARFELLEPAATGLDFRHDWRPEPEQAALIDTLFAGGGVAIGDADGDGRADVYLTRPFGGGQLFRNGGDWKFENVTDSAGLAGEGKRWATGASWADVDNDGDLDLFVAGFDSANRLFLNDGAGKFRDAATAAGLDFRGASVMMCWADYDGDGDLDGYLVTHRARHTENATGLDRDRIAELERRLRRDPNTGRLTLPTEFREDFDIVMRPNGRPQLIHAGQTDKLYRNEGRNPDGTPQFKEITGEAGVWDNGIGQAAAWWDYDNDGRPDLYVANDGHGADRLWHNEGNGSFRDVAPQHLRSTPWSSGGCDAADLNNDGWFDLIATNTTSPMGPTENRAAAETDPNAWVVALIEPRQSRRNSVYLNSGGGLPFMEIAHLLGCEGTGRASAARLADFDCDGWVDLLLASGLNPAAGPAAARDGHAAFRNAGGSAAGGWCYRLENVAASWGLARKAVSFGTACGDLDRDGDLDLVVNNFNAPCSLYRNEATAGGRVVIRLEGTANRWGVGARVVAEAGELKLARYLSPYRGLLGCDEPVVHFGLGERTTIDRLEIFWPGGARQELKDLPANHFFTIRQPPAAGTPTEIPPPASVQTIFRPSKALATAIHREQPFDDFAREPLLPNKLSRFGPGIAWGDVDDDGDDDFFLGGAAGAVARLYFNEPGSGESHAQFGVRSFAPFDADRACEDLGALFLDAESDGDLDLYVVSGGVEGAVADSYQDRLYLNDGRGVFAKAPPNVLPRENESGSCVVGADYDHDGDVDLFVGGRGVPQNHPQSPGSMLLRNDSTAAGAKLSDAAAEGQTFAGLQRVSGALWSDINNDSWPDLLVACDRSPLRVFLNVSASSGQETHPPRTRRFEEIKTAGIEKLDGCWTSLAAADFNHDGRMDYAAGNVGLNSRFRADPDDPLDTFETGIFWNETAPGGEVMLKFAALPPMAQIAPVFGIAVMDANFDGHSDLVLAQNFYHAHRESGRLDGGVGVVLLGDGRRGFTACWPNESGFALAADARGISITDVNGDRRPDLAVAVNDGPVRVFQHTAHNGGSPFAVRLRGPRGNPLAAGARITMHTTAARSELIEVSNGTGYLAQNSAICFFSLKPQESVRAVEVRWPDGQVTRQDVDPSKTLGPLTPAPKAESAQKSR